jgi:hypothetical protein
LFDSIHNKTVSLCHAWDEELGLVVGSKGGGKGEPGRDESPIQEPLRRPTETHAAKEGSVEPHT